VALAVQPYRRVDPFGQRRLQIPRLGAGEQVVVDALARGAHGLQFLDERCAAGLRGEGDEARVALPGRFGDSAPGELVVRGEGTAVECGEGAHRDLPAPARAVPAEGQQETGQTGVGAGRNVERRGG
jgi:hypothetical protein